MPEIRRGYPNARNHQPKHAGGNEYMRPPVCSTLGTTQQHIAVVIQRLDGLAYLVLTSLHPPFDAAESMKRIRRAYEDALEKVRKPRWRSSFTKYIIGTAHVQLVIPPGAEPTTKCSYPTVFLSEFSPNELLRHSWHNPAQLGHQRALKVISDEDLLVYLSCPDDLSGKPAIVMRQVLSKAKVALILLGLLVFGSVLGVVVGLCTGRADIALAVAAGGFACVTVLQSLIAWLVT